MFRKIMNLAVLAMTFVVAAPAFADSIAELDRNDRRRDRRDDRRDRRDDRRDRRDDRRDNRHRGPHRDRHGNWGRGRVIVDRGRHRYRPTNPYRFRRNHYRHRPWVGRWEDYVRVGLPAGAWVYQMGATSLSTGQDFDVIDVNDFTNCIRMVRIRVENADAHIDRVALHFTDGSDEELDVNGYYPANTGDYQWRDLAGWGQRCVDSIAVIGETMGRGGDRRHQARVEVWGMR